MAGTSKPLKRITRTQMVGVKRQLMAKQDGVCPLCGTDLKAIPSKNVVVDHDHSTGQIRGLLCRGCNGAEGKVKNSIQRWGKTKDIVVFLERLLEYYKEEATSYIYPSHKTEQEKRLAKNKKAREAYRKKRLAEYKEKKGG